MGHLYKVSEFVVSGIWVCVFFHNTARHFMQGNSKIVLIDLLEIPNAFAES